MLSWNLRSLKKSIEKVSRMVWFVWLCFVLQHSLKYYGGMSKIAILENTKNENKKS